MRRSIFTSLSLALYALSAACVTTYNPVATTEGAALKSSEAPQANGYLALTVNMSSATYRGNSSVEMHFKNQSNHEAIKLVLNSENFSTTSKPALFLLPVGKYAATKVLLKSPGGNYGGQGYLPFEIKLTFGEKIKDFEILPEELLHLGELTTKVSMELQNNTAPRMQYSESFENLKPDSDLWRSALKNINPKLARYLISTSSAPTLEIWDLEKTAEALPLKKLSAEKLRSKELRAKTNAVAFEMRACVRKFDPNFEGEASVEVLVGPKGTVEKFSLLKPVLVDSDKIKPCLDTFLKDLKISEQPNGGSNSFIYATNIRKD